MMPMNPLSLKFLLQLKEALKGYEVMLDSLIKEYFVNGLYRPLKLKVLYETPSSFNEAVQVARVKYQKLMYKLLQG